MNFDAASRLALAFILGEGICTVYKMTKLQTNKQETNSNRYILCLSACVDKNYSSQSYKTAKTKMNAKC